MEDSLIIDNVSAYFFRTSEFEELIEQFRFRISYDSATNQLTVSIPTDIHAEIIGVVGGWAHELCRAPGIIPDPKQFLVASYTVPMSNRCIFEYKQPDVVIRIKPPGEELSIPVLAVEVGWSQTAASLLSVAEMLLWEADEPTISTVILVDLHEDKRKLERHKQSVPQGPSGQGDRVVARQGGGGRVSR